jgi:hypothetical protein
LVSELCQPVGDELFFIWHIFLELGETQVLPSKIWQTVGDALKRVSSTKQLATTFMFFPSCCNTRKFQHNKIMIATWFSFYFQGFNKFD